MDYEEVGFRCGIEIHQQLETGKLFCRCPSLVNDPNKADIGFTRKLKAVTGETGKVDLAARHEEGKDRFINYEACSSSSCLVEMDEEPPHEMNPESVKIALQVALLLDARIVDEIQVMRKTVVDGSNVSGFQRTALIATDGHIDTSLGRVRVPTICLEEEAAKRITEDKDSITFRLDRLGVPLIEIGTEPDIKSPDHARETAEKLGMILRSTGKVKRGIGTIRQDVNISVRGGERVEIKGFQDLRTIPKVIDFEIERQLSIIKDGKKMTQEVRKAEADGKTTFLRPMPGSARMYPETDINPIIPDISDLPKVELFEDKVARYVKDYGLSNDLAKAISKDEWRVFEKAAKETGEKPAFIAESIISIPKEARRKHSTEINLSEDDYIRIFRLISGGKLTKDSILDAAIQMHEGRFNEDDLKSVDENEVIEDLRTLVKDMEGKPFGAVMGEAMRRYKGKIDGKRLSEILNSIK